MKNTGATSIAVAMLVTVLCSANFTVAQDCFDDPDLCAGPRSWREDFDEDPLDVSPDDWQQRANNTLPIYEDGNAIFDGSLAAWTLIDTADHYFEGETTVHIVMDANPATGLDQGAGWWVNADNEGNEGGFYAIFGVLQRNDDDEQEYRFGPTEVIDEIIPVAEGGVDVMVTLIPNGDNEELEVSYSITDANETQTGDFSIFGRDGPGAINNDKWFTLFSYADGQGIIDFVEVINQPEPGGGVTQLQAGDADMDFDFDQFDLILVQQAAEYLTGESATWGEGDWNGAPGGSQGDPPAGNGLFDQVDIIAALTTGLYLEGSYAAQHMIAAGSLAEAGDLASVIPVPEPSAMVLFALGLMGVVQLMRRNRG